MSYNLITILGPTAVGKTKLAAQLANRYKGEIISADSRQVYRGMDIGTGKDLDDYKIDSLQIPYHLIDVISPEDEFDLYKFSRHFHKFFEEVSKRNKIPFLVGGTGLYLHSVLSHYSLAPVDFNSERAKELQEMNESELHNLIFKMASSLHNTTDLIDKERIIKAILIAENADGSNNVIKINSLNIGIRLERDEIKRRITKRLKDRLQSGMIEEVERLVKTGVTHEKLQFFGLEYKYISLYLLDKLNYNDMYQKLNSAIHNFAKRQMTWFRKMEKEGIKINWVDGADFTKASSIIENEYLGNN